jgi:hypothetical protein
VRKAVRVAAFNRPRGVPVGERRVMAPVGRTVGLGAAEGLAVVVVVAEVRVMTVSWVDVRLVMLLSVNNTKTGKRKYP